MALIDRIDASLHILQCHRIHITGTGTVANQSAGNGNTLGAKTGLTVVGIIDGIGELNIYPLPRNGGIMIDALLIVEYLVCRGGIGGELELNNSNTALYGSLFMTSHTRNKVHHKLSITNSTFEIKDREEFNLIYH